MKIFRRYRTIEMKKCFLEFQMMVILLIAYMIVIFIIILSFFVWILIRWYDTWISIWFIDILKFLRLWTASRWTSFMRIHIDHWSLTNTTNTKIKNYTRVKLLSLSARDLTSSWQKKMNLTATLQNICSSSPVKKSFSALTSSGRSCQCRPSPQRTNH